MAHQPLLIQSVPVQVLSASRSLPPHCSKNSGSLKIWEQLESQLVVGQGLRLCLWRLHRAARLASPAWTYLKLKGSQHRGTGMRQSLVRGSLCTFEHMGSLMIKSVTSSLLMRAFLKECAIFRQSWWGCQLSHPSVTTGEVERSWEMKDLRKNKTEKKGQKFQKLFPQPNNKKWNLEYKGHGNVRDDWKQYLYWKLQVLLYLRDGCVPDGIA